MLGSPFNVKNKMVTITKVDNGYHLILNVPMQPPEDPFSPKNVASMVKSVIKNQDESEAWKKVQLPEDDLPTDVRPPEKDVNMVFLTLESLLAFLKENL